MEANTEDAARIASDDCGAPDASGDFPRIMDEFAAGTRKELMLQVEAVINDKMKWSLTRSLNVVSSQRCELMALSAHRVACPDSVALQARTASSLQCCCRRRARCEPQTPRS